MKKLGTVGVWVALFLAVVVLLWMQQPQEPRVTKIFAEFASDVAKENVSRIELNGRDIIVTDARGLRYKTTGQLNSALLEQLSEQGIAVDYATNSATSWITFLIPLILVLAFLLYFLRKARGGSAGNIMSLRRSPHREINPADSRATFADVGGCEEAKEALGDVIDFLKAPARWVSSGARLPRGILLEGPPGCGKTLLARAVAGETSAKFFLVSGSEFVEMFVGVGAARVRDLFETAIKKAPSVIFIDELDAVGRRRGSGIGGSHDEREQTLNQLLVCLDGFKRNDRVVVLAATNRPDVLDSALVRPGRIDRRIRVPELNEQTRLEILKIHARGKPVDGVDLREIARRTAGFSGARLETLTNETALLALRRARNKSSDAVRITQEDFVRALQPALAQDQRFNKLDSILIESASQLAEPTGTARVRLRLSNAPPVEGDVVWADASFLKIRRNHGEPDLIIAKRQVQQLEVLDGTDSTVLDDVQIDRWAVRRSETV